MKVLVACEYSGTVRDAFAALGHDAWSCDLLPTDKPGQHYQGDVLDIIEDGWDLMIAHPPCTYLTCAAEWAYKEPHEIKNKRLSPDKLYGAKREAARHEAILFFFNLIGEGFVQHNITKIAIENPVGVLSSAYGKPQQIIHPWMFGEDASKATCLWLKGLEPLTPTKLIDGKLFCCGEALDREDVFGCPNCNGDKKAKRIYGNQTPSGQSNLPPSADRWKIRSTTYPGIAAAMAAQWGGLVI